MKLLKSVRALAPVGFTMTEVMSGAHHFLGKDQPTGDLPFHFTLKWGTVDLARFLNPMAGKAHLTAEAEGHVSVGGLADNVPCDGTLELRYFTEAKIRYTFTFDKGDKSYRNVGVKINIRPWNLHRTHTTCYGTIWDTATGSEISRSIVYFKFNTIPGFLTSFRLTFGGNGFGGP